LIRIFGQRSHLASLFNTDIHDFDVFEWFIRLVCFHVLDRMYYLKSCKCSSEDRVFVIQPGCGGGRDEELRAVRARSSICHAHRIWPVMLINGCSTSKADKDRTHRSCLRSGLNSSSNSLPQILSPPVPSPNGSPVWIINFGITRWKITPSKYPLRA
jgi:hypothetical protein